MTITQTGPVPVRGVDGSSAGRNIEFSGLASGQKTTLTNFTVVDTVLTCTSPVTRGQATTCQPNTAPTNSTYTWKFTDANNNVVTPNNNTGVWQGTMVTGGTVDLTINGVALVPANITVNNRTNFAFTAVAPTRLMSNSITCYNGTTTVLDSPPTPTSKEGWYCPDLAFKGTAAQVTDGGLNHGYWYPSSVTDSPLLFSTVVPTKFEYIVVSDLLDPTSTFYTSQCGTFSASNPSGFIAGSQLN
ncbi:MAG: hypothetical protein L0099_14050, partial [Acidobacteria bacterium]|nr:hypothetical protein [Acidobacteriota bacterium]